MTKEDAKKMVGDIYGPDAASDDDIVDFYLMVNETAFDDLLADCHLKVSELQAENAALRAENERLRGLIPDGFNIWLSNNGWLYHNSGGYYYKRNCEWPPKQNEMSDYADLLKQFKTENNL